ncbi:hypothetical protein ACOMHN_033293 [Nucella lapillus]
MLPSVLLAWLLVTMATMQTGQGHIGVHKNEVMYHASINFTCNHPLGHDLDLSVFPPSQLRRVWILPNNDLIDTKTTTGQHEHVDILDNGAMLHVKNVEDEDFGWYHCVTYNTPEDTYLLQKYGLNVDGPYWGDLYEHKYKAMVTTGLVASAICLVSMSLLCFLYGRQQARLDNLAEEEKRLRVTEDDDKNLNQHREASTPYKSMTQYDNPAYVPDTKSSESAQKATTQHTTVSYEKEASGSNKGPAPGPPMQQELQNVLGADGAVAANGDAAASNASNPGDLDDERDPEDVKNLRPIPTTVVPIYRQRMVLVKIAGNFLRIGSGSKPILSKLKPPLRPPVNDDLLDYLEEIDNAKKKKAKKSARPQFMYQDFTFMADESASITESWYRQARAFFHVRLGIQRGQSTEDIEYLCAIRTPNDQYEVIFDKNTFGSWWRITALSLNTYVAESVQFPGRCLTKGVFGVALSPPLTQRERAGISRGNMDEGRTITIYTLPDFAVWHPGVCIN